MLLRSAARRLGGGDEIGTVDDVMTAGEIDQIIGGVETAEKNVTKCIFTSVAVGKSIPGGYTEQISV